MSIGKHTVIAANRFGLGARPGELDSVGRDPRAWLHAQLNSPAAVHPAIAALPESADILAEFQGLRATPGQSAVDVPRRLRELLGPAYQQQVLARYQAGVETTQPFRERLVQFWSNHFAVSADKPPVTALAAGLENEAIRPGLDGSFADLLLAVTRHPAMLLYLDNQASIGPNSRLAQRARRSGRAQRQFDINENLGREILELHTLGVQGGYSQDDVIALATILTGWSVGGGRGRLRAGSPGQFEFRAAVHEPGGRNLLGRRYAQSGQAQGEAALRDLAMQPATARHLAEKLARHFVADQPDTELIEHLAAVYLRSDGQLPALHAALVDAPAAWQQDFAKFKTPSEFVLSALRALQIVPPRARELAGGLMLLGQPAYRPGSPAGWPDQAASWDGADGLMKRIEWATTVGQRLAGVIDPLQRAQAVLGPALGEHSAMAIRRAESRAQGVALLLMSPEFQRR